MRLPAVSSILLLLFALSLASASPIDVFAQQRSELRAPAIKLARAAAKTYLTTGKNTSPQRNLPELFKRRAAVFVTITKHGRRRGCKGVFEPATSCLADEIIRASIGATVADIRYRPIRSNEFKDLVFTVSIVGTLKRVRDPEDYDPATYGLLIKGASGSGVLLPGEAKTSRWRMAEARRQARVRPGEPCEIFVFETVALHDDTPSLSKPQRR